MDVPSILLGFLSHRPMTGYDLRKFFSISFAFFSGMSYGSIYPALRRMEREGLVTVAVKARDGAPNRKVYTITGKGRKHFIKALRAPFAFEVQKNAFLMHLFFFAHLSPAERLGVAGHYLDSIGKALASVEAAQSEIDAHADPYQRMVLSFGTQYLQDLAANVGRVVSLLKGEEEAGDREKQRRQR